MTDPAPFHSWIKDQDVKPVERPTICKTCNGDGFVRCRDIRTELGYTVVFKCYCPVGMNKQKNWPMWSRRWEYRYAIISG